MRPGPTTSRPIPGARPSRNSPRADGMASRAGGGWLLLAAVVLAAVNLRTAALSFGPLLAEVRSGAGLSAPVAGLVVSLPALCFAVAGPATPTVARRAGIRRTLAAALGLMAAGTLSRGLVGDAGTFLACSAVAFSGAAMASVLLPMIGRVHFSGRIGPFTSAYTTAMALGATVAAASAVPVADLAAARGWAADPSAGWRFALAIWAVPAAAALLSSAMLGRRLDAPPTSEAGDLPIRPRRRLRLGWGLACYYGAASLQALVTMGWLAELFRAAGSSPATAGYLLAAATALSVLASLVVPAVAARRPSQQGLVVLLSVCHLVGYTGLLLAPMTAVWLWAVLIGAGFGALPLALTLIGLKASTPRETASLSAFAQTAGHLLAATGPVLAGGPQEVAGPAGPFAVLYAAWVVQLGAGLYLGRPVPPSPSQTSGSGWQLRGQTPRRAQRGCRDVRIKPNGGPTSSG